MITIRAGRQRPKDRKPTESDKTTAGRTKTYNAPINGLVTATTKGSGTGAVVLDNFWPTPTGIEPRGGAARIGTASTRIRTLFEHRATGAKFAATATQILPFTDSALGAAAVSGLTGGEWITFEVQNAGGSNLIAVNGADTARRFDGTAWSTASITGVASTSLSYVWGHRNRVFFIQGNTLSAWYLGTNSIGGAATELPLSAVFRNGGRLIAGATWSSDSGDGMDDRCVFITDAGEVAVFSGSNPGDINSWSLVGVYEVGPILGPKAITSLAGDLVFATTAGLIPLSGAVQKDPAELASVSISAPVSPDWQAESAVFGVAWRIALWDKGRMIAAVPIGSSRQLAANVETNAWCRITGWTCSDLCSLGGGLYMADMDGGLFRAWYGGSDDGDPVICRAMLAHDHLDAPASIKIARMVRPVFRHIGDLHFRVSVSANYSEDFPPLPDTVSDISAAAEGLWDVSDWDTTAWASESMSYRVRSRWEVVAGAGESLGVQIQILTNSAQRVPLQLQRIDLLYDLGGIGL